MRRTSKQPPPRNPKARITDTQTNPNQHRAHHTRATPQHGHRLHPPNLARQRYGPPPLPPSQTTTNPPLEALPPPLVSFLRAHLLDPSSPSQHLLQRFTPVLTQLTSLLTPLLDRLAAALAASPDLVVLAFFLGVVVFVFQVLAYLRRLMMWWTRMAMRLVFWSAVVAGGAVVWRRGVEASLADAVYWGGKVAGFAEGVKGVFWAEYQRYEEMERNKGQGGGGAGTRRGW